MNTKPTIPTCPHVDTTTVVNGEGDVFVAMGKIDREFLSDATVIETFDCEVCRKLLAFDAILQLLADIEYSAVPYRGTDVSPLKAYTVSRVVIRRARDVIANVDEN